MRRPRIAQWAAGCVAATLFAFAPSGWAAPPVPPEEAKAQLAPGGILRVGLFMTNRSYVTQGTPAGELRGVAVDIARALATQLGAKFEPVSFATIAQLLDSAGTGRWDVAFMGIDPARAGLVDYTPSYMHSENSYLVPAGSGLKTVSDVDRDGVRVASAGRTVQHAYLKANLKSAKLVTVQNALESIDQIAAGKVDAFAAGKDQLEGLAVKMPGYRVLPGSFRNSILGLAVPKGRAAGAAYATEFIRYMKESGAVAKAIADANLRGAVVPRD